MRHNKLALLGVLGLLLVVVACAPATPVALQETESNQPAADWKTVLLHDARTGNAFTISDFKGKPVLVESFAVWCPICLKQQQQMKKLHDEQGEAVVLVSLDTDPNEDAEKVKAHLNQNRLDWYFAVAPSEVTKALITEFGVTVVNAPSAPVILVCPDQSSRLLSTRVKDAEKLQSEIAQGC